MEKSIFMNNWSNKFKIDEINNIWLDATKSIDKILFKDLLKNDNTELRGLSLDIPRNAYKGTFGPTTNDNLDFFLDPYIMENSNMRPLNGSLVDPNNEAYFLMFNDRLYLNHNEESKSKKTRKYLLFGPVVDEKTIPLYSSISAKIIESHSPQLQLVHSDMIVRPLYTKDFSKIMGLMDKYKR